MFRPTLALLLFAGASAANSATPSGADSAESQALIGHNDLGLGRLEDAKANCDAALKIDPANATAKDCLQRAASMMVDRDLNVAGAKLLQGDNKGAMESASKWTYNAPEPGQRKHAQDIVRWARYDPSYVLNAITPDWLRQTLAAIAAIVVLDLLLIACRKLWREWRRAKWYGGLAGTTRWTMLPLKEMTESPTGVPTDDFLDALLRLPDLLRRPLWKPRLLLLRPTPPADHDPSIIDSLVSALDPPPFALSPEPGDLGIKWKEHDVQLDDALRTLQLKTVSGFDLGTVAKFLGSIVHWFNVGAPVISGIAQTGADGSVSIHVVASGGKINCVSVTASIPHSPGIDVTQLTAQRAAFKLLLRMRYHEMTNNEIEGFAALRQAVNLFTQYAGTVRGVGDGAQTRDSSLRQSACDFGLFRSSIPIHKTCDNADSRSPAIITDEIRQAALLAEGVAHALVGDEAGLNAAVVCFRELQDWSGRAETSPLHRQAAYNEAIVWRLKGSYARTVLMLTELLGEHAPDTEARHAGAREPSPHPALTVAADDPMRFPVRLARLSAFAEYTLDDWTTLPEERVNLLMGDSETLVKDLKDLSRTNPLSDHDQRVTRYIYQEALRAIGHVEVLRIVSGSGARLYDQDHRPTGLRTGHLNAAGHARLEQAIEWMKEAEEVLPTPTLYCDLAEAHILVKRFNKAGGYARHATLQESKNERAFYLASESYLLEGTEVSLSFAKKYAAQFATPSSTEFIALRRELQIQ